MSNGLPTVETVIVGGTPGGNHVAPTPGAPSTIEVDQTRQYVAGGRSWLTAANVPRVLDARADDLSGDFGPDIYTQMRRDPAVAAAIRLWVASVLEDGITVTSAIDTSATEHAGTADGLLANQMADEIKAMFAALDLPMAQVLDDVLDSALTHGYKVCELVWALVDTDNGPRFNVTAVVPKPRDATLFVVDAYNTVVGLTARIPGMGWGLYGMTLIDPSNAPQLLPRSKFFIYSHQVRNADPRGTYAMRPAYNGWNLKWQLWQVYLKYLVTLAGPTILGTTPENALAITLSDGTVVTAQAALLAALTEVQASSAGAFPAGTTFTVVDPSTAGSENYQAAFTLLEKEIFLGIIGNPRVLTEAEHGSKADTGTAQDALDTQIRQAKQAICDAIMHDIVKPWVRLNYGANDRYMRLAPKIGLGSVEEQDRTPLMNAVAALDRVGYLDPTQYAEIDRLLNLPQRDQSALALKIKAYMDGLSMPVAAPVVAQGASNGDTATQDTEGAQNAPNANAD